MSALPATPPPAAAFPAARRRWLPGGETAVVAVPYVWFGVFFLLPFLIVLKISFSEFVEGTPPYAPLLEWAEDGKALLLKLRLANYQYLFEDDLYVFAYLNSIRLAAVSTLLALLVGYPMAYAIARTEPSRRRALLMLVMLPFWTSFLIRVYAWIGILNTNGLINNSLMALGVVAEPLPLLNNDFAMYLGIVYSYLPFMVLPLYATLERLDPTLLEAAADLGCKPLKAFLAITLPLSAPGIIAGCLLVFIPAVGEYVIPELLGGPDQLMIGKVLYDEFALNRDWPVASAVAVAMLLLLVVPIMLFQRVQAAQGDGR